MPRGGPLVLQKGGPPGSVGGLSWRCVGAWLSIPFFEFKMTFFGFGAVSGRSICAPKGCSPGVRGRPFVVKGADFAPQNRALQIEAAGHYSRPWFVHSWYTIWESRAAFGRALPCDNSASDTCAVMRGAKSFVFFLSLCVVFDEPSLQGQILMALCRSLNFDAVFRVQGCVFRV